MAAFNHIPMGEEGLRKVYKWLDDWVAQNRKIAHKEIIGRSPEGWEIPAVFITDETISNNYKQTGVRLWL